MRRALAGALLLTSCTSHAVPPPLEVAPEQFTVGLTVSSRRETTVTFRLELENRSEITVCVGYVSAVFFGDRAHERRQSTGQSCGEPAVVVPPGETRAWKYEAPLPKCTDELPPNLGEAFPERVCGAKVETRAELRIYGMAPKKLYRGSVTVLSEPASILLEPGDVESDLSDPKAGGGH